MSTNIDLISLIYEYNNNSALFARVAKKMVDAGEFENAKEVLDKGIKNFPDYATPFFVYSILYAKLGDNEMAEKMAAKGNSILNNNDTYSFYSSYSGDEIVAESNTIKNEEKPAKAVKSYNENELHSIISEFGEALFDKKSIGETTKKTAASPNNKIISETLANIHYSQGHYNEALEIYRLLIQKTPDRTSFYEGKIEEIEKKMHDSK